MARYAHCKRPSRRFRTYIFNRWMVANANRSLPRSPRRLGSVTLIALVTLLVAGLLVTGAGVREVLADRAARASQAKAVQAFQSQLADEQDVPLLTKAGDHRPAPTTTLPQAPLYPDDPLSGEQIGDISIPAIGKDLPLYEDAENVAGALNHGPSHYVETPLPGQAGNAAVAGHRTTNGAPFFDLDQLKSGDLIIITTSSGYTVTYVVFETVIVSPDDVDAVLRDFGDNRLTLHACNPKYSAKQRIVVRAHLVSTTHV